MRLVFNPITAKLDWVDLPAGVLITRSGNTVTMSIDGQTAQQWIKEAVGLDDMAGNPLDDMDGNPLDGVG